MFWLLNWISSDPAARLMKPGLITAAKNGDSAKVGDYIQQGAYVDYKDDNGNTALHVAALNGHVAVVKILLENGANVNAKNNDEVYPPTQKGYKPIHLAAYKGHVAVVEMLLDAGVDVNCRSANGATPMHTAFFEKKINVIDYLVSRGGDINAADHHGYTPLHALFLGHTSNDQIVERYKELLDLEARDNTGKTAFDYYIRRVFESSEEELSETTSPGGDLQYDTYDWE